MIALLSQWLGHTTWTFTRGIASESHAILELMIGAAGFTLVWRGLNKPEVTATWMGVLGGLLIWVGWFEFTFDFFADFFAIPEWTSPTGMPGSGGLVILMSTMPLMLALLLVYGFANRQTKCNFIRWFHRRLGVSPGVPTSGAGRSFARIAAMETLFVTWFCYQFWLYVGYLTSNTVFMTAYVLWTAWAVFIFTRLIKIPRVGHAVRYGVPVGIVGWGVVEMPTHMGLYSEIWLKPFDYPLPSLITLSLFVLGFIYVARTPQRPARVSASES
jgi:hypothetical protein